MEKISKDFWGKEILLCGCEQKDKRFYKMLYDQFTKHGVTVYALPTVPETDPGFQTYPDLAALPHVPQCAFVLCPTEQVPDLTETLRQAGVSRILLYNKKKASDSYVEKCKEKGVEVRAGCPLMLYGGGPCGLHASIEGLSAERSRNV